MMEEFDLVIHSKGVDVSNRVYELLDQPVFICVQTSPLFPLITLRRDEKGRGYVVKRLKSGAIRLGDRRLSEWLRSRGFPDTHKIYSYDEGSEVRVVDAPHPRRGS